MPDVLVPEPGLAVDVDLAAAAAAGSAVAYASELLVGAGLAVAGRCSVAAASTVEIAAAAV